MAEKHSRYQLVDNFKLPCNFPKEKYLSAIAYKPRDEDMFISGYPRCGTTWTQQILYLIFHNGNPPEGLKGIIKSSPYMEMTGAESAFGIPRPCTLKFHLPFHLMPYSSKAKYIYVTRNPKDCCVSLYYLLTTTIPVNPDRSFDKHFEDFIQGNIQFGDYFDHVLSWYNHRDDPNVLFLIFEEMKHDVFATVKKICAFLRGHYEEMINDAEIMEKITIHSSFDFMKKNINEDIKNAITGVKDDKDLPGFKDIWTDKSDCQLVRKGEIGDWRNHLSADQTRRMEEKMKDRLTNTDLLQMWINI